MTSFFFLSESNILYGVDRGPIQNNIWKKILSSVSYLYWWPQRKGTSLSRGWDKAERVSGIRHGSISLLSGNLPRCSDALGLWANTIYSTSDHVKEERWGRERKGWRNQAVISQGYTAPTNTLYTKPAVDTLCGLRFQLEQEVRKHITCWLHERHTAQIWILTLPLTTFLSFSCLTYKKGVIAPIF